ncbi:MAG: hypothetical protein KDC79_01890 [Cyclobacteriaceae bacterium]|nr:hypothetical protein [Cyclobacteriaceae bacterium]
MKKYFVLGAAVVILGLLINYALGGFAAMEPKLIEVNDYTIYGEPFEGSYKSTELSELVNKMREKQKQFGEAADVVIVNYFNEDKERVGYVKNFVGLQFNASEPDSIAGLQKKIIKANKALEIKIKIKPLIMPTPEKIQDKATEMAEFDSLKLKGLSIEQYKESGVLVVEFPIEDEKK